MSNSPKLDRRLRQRLSSVLGLTLDGSRLEGLVLQRADRTLQARQPFSVVLSLDPLTSPPELVGREIRNHLDGFGISERHCVVGLPLKWALATHVEVPDLPDADTASFLQIEAERGFPCDIQTLLVSSSRCRPPAGPQQALLIGIPRNHAVILEQVLHAAKLKPVSFSLGITALQPGGVEASNGVLALAIGETHVALQVTTGGGVAALRMLEGALETEGSQRILHPDLVAREARITLGQLPAGLRETVRRIRIFGPRDLAQQLADEMELRFEAMGLEVQCVARYDAKEFGVDVPADTAVSAAFSLAAQRLAGKPGVFEFLPPRVTAWQQMSGRLASGKLRASLTGAGAVAAIVVALFFYQQSQLWALQTEWSKLAPTCKVLAGLQQNIKDYRAWYDESFAGLTILKTLSEKFPEDNSVTAKTVEIRDLATVVCTGTAKTYPALLKMVERLRAADHVRDVSLGSTRGQAPALQFTFTVTWNEGGPSAN